MLPTGGRCPRATQSIYLPMRSQASTLLGLCAWRGSLGRYVVVEENGGPEGRVCRRSGWNVFCQSRYALTNFCIYLGRPWRWKSGVSTPPTNSDRTSLSDRTLLNASISTTPNPTHPVLTCFNSIHVFPSSMWRAGIRKKQGKKKAIYRYG